MNRWVLGEYPLQVWDNTVYLRLLEEYLREPDTIENLTMGIVSPWEMVTSLILVPCEETLPRE